MKAKLVVKAKKDVGFQKFAEECSTMVGALGDFIEKSALACAEADDSNSDDAFADSLKILESLLSAAEHHAIGVVAAKKRFSAML